MNPDPPTAIQPKELDLTIVRYADNPDRCTLHPPNVSSDARLATWLSADRDAFVALESIR